MGIAKYAQDKYVFSAAISRNAIYDKFVKGFKAMTIHRSIAATIEENNRGREKDVAEDLAIHYYLAHDKDRGAHYCNEAGDKAKEKYANQDYIRYYTWPSELLGGATEDHFHKKLIESQLKRATMMSFIGSTSEALTLINDVQKFGG